MSLRGPGPAWSLQEPFSSPLCNGVKMLHGQSAGPARGAPKESSAQVSPLPFPSPRMKAAACLSEQLLPSPLSAPRVPQPSGPREPAPGHGPCRRLSDGPPWSLSSRVWTPVLSSVPSPPALPVPAAQMTALSQTSLVHGQSWWHPSRAFVRTGKKKLKPLREGLRFGRRSSLCHEWPEFRKG